MGADEVLLVAHAYDEQRGLRAEAAGGGDLDGVIRNGVAPALAAQALDDPCGTEEEEQNNGER
jgi:hypothetical protein